MVILGMLRGVPTTTSLNMVYGTDSAIDCNSYAPFKDQGVHSYILPFRSLYCQEVIDPHQLLCQQFRFQTSQ